MVAEPPVLAVHQGVVVCLQVPVLAVLQAVATEGTTQRYRATNAVATA